MRQGFPMGWLASIGLILAVASCGDLQPPAPVSVVGVDATSPVSTITAPTPSTTTSTSPPPAPVADLLFVPELFRDRLVELVEEAGALRGMSFPESLPVDVITAQEMTRRLRAPASNDPDQVRVKQTLYQLLGLVEPDTDWAETEAGFRGRATPGFYDPSSRSLWLLSTLETPTPLQEMTLVGEIAKALLDHNLGIWERMHRLAPAGDSDLLTAMGALAEADSTLVELLFRDGLTPEQQRQVPEEAQARSVGEPELPSFMQAALRFSSGPALDYLQRLYQLGGWDLINDAHRNPPDSTEQILVLAVDRPEPILLPRPAVVPPAGYREIADSVWGQWGWHTLLSSVLDADQASSASWGWGGDRYLIFSNGAQVALVVNYLGDTPTDTGEMVTAFREYLPQGMAVGTERPQEAGWEYYDEHYAWLSEGAPGEALTFIAATDVELGRQLRAYLFG